MTIAYFMEFTGKMACDFGLGWQQILKTKQKHNKKNKQTNKKTCQRLQSDSNVKTRFDFNQKVKRCNYM